jgi:leukotriene-A4 hydrolase
MCLLQQAVDHYGADHCFTCLHIEMKDVDPDDSFSSVPYEKGCAFLTYLEQLLGGPAVFEPYLKAHGEF